MPILRRSLPPVVRVADPTKPDPMQRAMVVVVVVVLVRRQLGAQRLESPGPVLPRVKSTCFKCFRCLVGMLQVFHADVVKVDRDVAYVAMIIHVCCKCMFPMFHLFFQTYVTNAFI
jgi:hypothetical protein